MHCFYSEITLNSLNSCSVFFLGIMTNFFDANKLFQYWFCKIIWRFSGSVMKYSGWSALELKHIVCFENKSHETQSSFSDLYNESCEQKSYSTLFTNGWSIYRSLNEKETKT